MQKLVACLFVVFTIYTANAQPLKGTKWSADGNSYYAVEGGEIVQYQLPSFTKKTIVSKENLVVKATGKALAVRNFFFSNDLSKVLIYTNAKKVWRYDTKGDYWIMNLATNTFTQIGKDKLPSSLMFAKLSPDGTKVAYVYEHNLYVEDLATATTTALTKDGTDKLINGTFDWAYEEEFGCRDGFRWSDDSKKIAFWQIDASKIKFFLMMNNTDSIYSFNKPVEYPKVGEDPSSCKIGVVNISTAKTIFMNVPGNAVQHYIPRMEWSGDNQLIIQQLNRKQQESKLMLLNTINGSTQTIFTEKDTAWIDIKSRWNDDDPSGWEFINKRKDFIWVSEKDGWRHLYKISTDGKTETLLTKGNYDVESINAIDEKNGIVYFSASPNNATQLYLYSVQLDGKGDAKLISTDNKLGTNKYQLNPIGTFGKHSFSNYYTTPINEWISLPNYTVIKESSRKAVENKNKSVQMIQIKTADNTVMDAWVMYPKNFDSTKKYPVVFYVYTEPGATTVSDSYGNANGFLYAGDMAADGYIHISVDGRGTPSLKGSAWRKSIYKKVGILNVYDQAMAAKEILKWNYVDPSRVAVWGWSGGGSTTLNLMFQYPDIYTTGIAVAPVANRLTYDNIYEERYMGLPQENKADYIKASATTYAKGLKGNLLVIHGTGDDNVHYQNTEMLINELVKYGKPFQMMSYPNRTHSINEGAGTSMHLVNLATKYLQDHCALGGR